MEATTRIELGYTVLQFSGLHPPNEKRSPSPDLPLLPSPGSVPVAFNTAENWSRDVSEDIAAELGRRLSTENRDIAPDIADFLERHASASPAQLPLPLKGAA